MYINFQNNVPVPTKNSSREPAALHSHSRPCHCTASTRFRRCKASQPAGPGTGVLCSGSPALCKGTDGSTAL